MNQKFDDFLARFVRIEPGEKRAVFTAFALMFCVMGGYFSVRPIRETVGTILGEVITSDTWIWTAVFAIAIIPVYGFLVARVSRATLVPAIYGTVAIALAATGVVFRADPHKQDAPAIVGPNLNLSSPSAVGIAGDLLEKCGEFGNYLVQWMAGGGPHRSSRSTDGTSWKQKSSTV